MPSQSALFQITLFVNIIGVFLVFGYIGWMLYRRNKNHPFPDRHDVEIIHQEHKASGNSHKTFFTRIGGANNSLTVIVTPIELWITVPWFFGWIAPKCNVEHRISLDAITNIERKKNKLTIHWSTEDNLAHTFDLILRHPDAFLKAVGHIPES